jgi:hypothetical protein
MRRYPMLGALMAAATSMAMTPTGVNPSKVLLDELAPHPHRDRHIPRINPGSGRGRAKCMSVAEGKRRARKRRNVQKEKARGHR